MVKHMYSVKHVWIWVQCTNWSPLRAVFWPNIILLSMSTVASHFNGRQYKLINVSLVLTFLSQTIVNTKAVWNILKKIKALTFTEAVTARRVPWNRRCCV